MRHYRLKIEKKAYCAILTLFLLGSCGGFSSENRNFESDSEIFVDSPRIEDSKSIANRYSEIKKEFNQLEIIVDTLRPNLSDERLESLRDKLLKLQLESKNLTTDFEANKISNEQNKDLLNQGISYVALADLTEKLVRVLG